MSLIEVPDLHFCLRWVRNSNAISIVAFLGLLLMLSEFKELFLDPFFF